MKDSKTELTTEEIIAQQQLKVADLLAIPPKLLEGLNVKALRGVGDGLLKTTHGKGRTKEVLLKELLIIREQALKALEDSRLQVQQSKEFKTLPWSSKELTSTSIKAKEMIDTIISKTAGLSESDRLEFVVTYAASVLEGFRREDYAPTSIKGMLTEIGTVIKNRPTDSDTVKTSLTTFKNALWKLFEADKKLINFNDSIRVGKNIDAEKTVNGNALLSKAKSILEKVPSEGVFEPPSEDNPKQQNPVKWTEVAAALILVTGRRPAEILSSAVFEPGDSINQLRFKGQLKGKGEFNALKMKEVYQIPCLVDSDVAIKALKYLEKKRVSSPGLVNEKYGRELSREAKHWRSIAEIKTKKEEPKEGEPKEETKGYEFPIYSLRKVYASLCKKFYYTGDERGVFIYVAKLMGHNPEDHSTVQTYREFEVEVD